MEGGDLLLVDAVQALAGGEGGDGVHGHAVGHGGGHGQHHTKAVEHGNLDHHPVGGGEVHAVADGLAVVHHVVVREHHALGEARGAGGVLHVAHVVLAHLAAAVLHLGGGHGIAQAHGVLPGVAALLLAVHGDDIAQHRQALGVELARQAVLKLGAQLLDDANIIRVLVAVDHHQGVGVGLAQQVLGLVDLIGGVHRHQHRPDFGGGPEGDVPLGHVGGPNSHMVPLLHPHGDEGPGKLVHVVPELRIGAGVIQLGVLKAELVGELLDHTVQHIGEGGVDKGLLGPDVLAGLAQVVLEAMVAAALGQVLGHEIGKVREHDARVAQVGHILFDPLQGNKALVIDGAQGAHHGVHGQVTLAHEAIGNLAILHNGVLDVGILDIHA